MASAFPAAVTIPCSPTVCDAGNTPPLLEVQNLSKAYGERIALEGVSFAVRQGEFVAVLGRSGAGKTTLFRCITGLASADHGRVLLRGADTNHFARSQRRQIAVVFQQFNLVNRLSALQNVLAGRLGYVPAWRGVLRRFSRDDYLLALECLERVGLLSLARRRADTLSGGQQQRVAIARALAQQPRIIIADEPVASLDPRTGAEILDLLRSICHGKQDGIGLVCSLHQLQFAKDYADRIIGLAQGRLVTDVSAEDFSDDSATGLYGNTLGIHA